MNADPITASAPEPGRSLQGVGPTRWIMPVLRFAAMLGLAVWYGGFVFYSAVVLPVLHETWDSLEVGLTITPTVTDRLNAIGVGVLALWALLAIIEANRVRRDRRRVAWLRDALIVASTVLLATLMGLHRVMDAWLEAGSLNGFYPWHRAYLVLSTVHFAVHTVLLAASLMLWSSGDRGS